MKSNSNKHIKSNKSINPNLIKALTAKLEIMGRLETDNNQLRAQLESMQRELDDSTEKCMRIEMVEKAYRNSQQRIQAMTAEIKQLQQENEQLKLKVQELELQLSDIKEKNAAAAAAAANTTPQVVDTFDMLLQRQIPQITFPSYSQNKPAAADPNSVATSSQQAEERPNETEVR
jgi:predicted RNase H-like nuclease (RuvC/YqgF family)